MKRLNSIYAKLNTLHKISLSYYTYRVFCEQNNLAINLIKFANKYFFLSTSHIEQNSKDQIILSIKIFSKSFNITSRLVRLDEVL